MLIFYVIQGLTVNLHLSFIWSFLIAWSLYFLSNLSVISIMRTKHSRDPLDLNVNRWQNRSLVLRYFHLTSLFFLHLFPKCSPGISSVSVMEVECIREGCQSETLRQMAGSVPEGRCLTVVFKGSRKSLDLLCQSREEAQHWVRGIRTLQGRVENMTQKEKLDQYPFLVHSELYNCL